MGHRALLSALPERAPPVVRSDRAPELEPADDATVHREES
jgi:hypothetical protein